MKIVCIFEVHEETREGLYAMHYDGETQNEFDRLFDLWIDSPEYVLSYLRSNESYLACSYFKDEPIHSMTSRIRDEAAELQELLADYSDEAGEKKLQEIFRPLKDGELFIPVHQQTKASIKNSKYRRALLRLYAIRIGPNSYVITGGAIKITKTMQEHEDTNYELKKIEIAKRYLRSIDLFDEDDLIYVL